MPLDVRIRSGRSTLRSPAILVSLVLGTALATLMLVAAPSATAAAGDPFDPSTQRLFASKSASQSDPTGVFELSPNSGGTYTFAQIGTDADLVHNALTYNPLDNYLYAITGNPLDSDVPAQSLIKIGATGGYTVVGSSQFRDPDDTGAQIYIGAVDPETGVFYVMNGDPSTPENPTSQLIRIDIDPTSSGYGTASGAPVTLSTGWNNVNRGSDFTYSGGFLWALGDTALSRIDPTDGTVTTFPVPAQADSSDGDQAGAAWTFSNGDLGFSYNTSGLVIRISVTDPSSATPTITTVLASGGAPSGQNDGAAIPGTVDLSITKAAAKIDQDKRVRWTLVVKNEGGNPSTGWTVTDTIPAGFTDISVSGGDSSTVDGRDVTVLGGALAVDATETITIEATVTEAVTPTVTNTATVTGDDPDAVATNNVASAELTYPTTTPGGGTAGPGVPATGVEAQDNGLNLSLLVLGLLLTGGAGIAYAAQRRRDRSA